MYGYWVERVRIAIHGNRKFYNMKKFEYKTLEFEPIGKWLSIRNLDKAELERKKVVLNFG